MAITQDFNDISYNGTGGTTDFDLATKVFATTEVAVFLTVVSTGVVTTLTEGVGAGTYVIAAISGDLDNGVRITPDPVVPSGTQITLERIVTETQGLALVEGGDLPSAELVDALDRGIMISQQISSNQARTPIHPVTDPSGTTYDIPSAVDRAGDVLGWDSAGNVVNLSLVTSGTVTVDTSKGLGITSNQIFAKVDEVTTTFTGNNIAVKALGIDTAELAADAVETVKILNSAVTKAKIENVSAQTVLGNTTASSSPVEVPIVGATGILIDDDTLGASDLKGATQGNIKAYVDGFDSGSSLAEDGYQKLPSGLIMQWGKVVSVSANTTETITLPTPFITTFYNASATFASTNAGLSESAGATAFSLTQIKVTNIGGVSTDIFWQAIGK